MFTERLTPVIQHSLADEEHQWAQRKGAGIVNLPVNKGRRDPPEDCVMNLRSSGLHHCHYKI